MGISMYTLLCGAKPYDFGIVEDICNFQEGEVIFDLTDDEERKVEIINGEKYVNPLVFFDNVSEEAKDLIRNMLCVDPKERCTIESALEHPWFSMFNERNVYSPGTKEILNALELSNE